MKTLTINLPDTIDPAIARWEMARSLYEKGNLDLAEAAKLAELAPTYFKMRLEGMVTGIPPKTSQPVRKGLAIERIREIAEKMDVQESWEELVAMVGK